MFLSYFTLLYVFINNRTSQLSMYMTDKHFFTATPHRQVPDYYFMLSDKMFRNRAVSLLQTVCQA